MDWINDVMARNKRKNRILFAQDSLLLQDLATQIKEQSHQVVALWALEFAEQIATLLQERYPNEPRPMQAVETSRKWSQGLVKMREAQRAILQAHAVAKDIAAGDGESASFGASDGDNGDVGDDWAGENIALCHAVGQACGVVHAPGHALGLPIYELTAIVRHHGINACKAPVETRLQEYRERLSYWYDHYKEHPQSWASFF